MEIILRLVAFLLNVLGLILHPFIILKDGFRPKKLPPIKSDLLKLSASDLAMKIRSQEIKSEDVVKAYIERIKDVNPILNAVLEDRFEDAIKDAQRADHICSITPPIEIIKRYPLLGVPFTIKESCSLKGMPLEVGSVPRKGIKAFKDGEVVERLKSAGAIPLLISANPEYCLSWETNTLLNGRCNNPYDPRRTPGGSSGGEGALNGAGATVFGVGSDVGGSIRVPGLFNGIFGHKPTGGLVSVKGHFPSSTDSKFGYYLQIGPMTRFARDLPILMHIMAGDNAQKMEIAKTIETKDIKIYYLEDAGFTFTHSPVDFEIKLAILKAVKYFEACGLKTQKADFLNMADTMEASLATVFEMQDIPDMLVHPDDPKKKDNLYIELAKHIIGKPKYSFASLFFILLQESKGFISEDRRKEWVKRGAEIRQKMIEMLGNDGVFFYPTYHSPALRHGQTVTNFPGVMFPVVFNIFGFPATHVPMGLNSSGLPIGFQIVAAPYQDKLCLQVAGELELAFGGWVPPPSSLSSSSSSLSCDMKKQI